MIKLCCVTPKFYFTLQNITPNHCYSGEKEPIFQGATTLSFSMKSVNVHCYELNDEFSSSYSDTSHSPLRPSSQVSSNVVSSFFL